MCLIDRADGLIYKALQRESETKDVAKVFNLSDRNGRDLGEDCWWKSRFVNGG